MLAWIFKRTKSLYLFGLRSAETGRAIQYTWKAQNAVLSFQIATARQLFQGPSEAPALLGHQECLIYDYELLPIRITLKYGVLVYVVTYKERVLSSRGHFIFQAGPVLFIISTPSNS